MDVVQVYGIALEKGEYDSSDYANSLNWLWSRMKDMVADLRQTLKGGVGIRNYCVERYCRRRALPAGDVYAPK